MHKRDIISLFIIFLISFLVYIIAFRIPNEQLSNRFLHAFGGGFLAFLICFLIVKNTNLQLTKFQFFIFSFLLVTAMGVTNEILEFFLQNYAGFIFSASVNDTWLDLISNAVGALIAGAVLVPFVNRTKTNL